MKELFSSSVLLFTKTSWVNVFTISYLELEDQLFFLAGLFFSNTPHTAGNLIFQFILMALCKQGLKCCACSRSTVSLRLVFYRSIVHSNSQHGAYNFCWRIVKILLCDKVYGVMSFTFIVLSTAEITEGFLSCHLTPTPTQTHASHVRRRLWTERKMMFSPWGAC